MGRDLQRRHHHLDGHDVRKGGAEAPLFAYVTEYDTNRIILLKITLFSPFKVGSTPTAGINTKSTEKALNR